MKSYRKTVMRTVNREMERRNSAVGFIVQAAAQKRIRDYGLVDEGRMLTSITHKADEYTVEIGTPINDPPYPTFLHLSFRNHITGEIIGPFPFLTEGLLDSIAMLETVYGKKIVEVA